MVTLLDQSIIGAHAEAMSDPQPPRRFNVPIDELEDGARVAPKDQVEAIEPPPEPAIPTADPMFGYGIHAG